MDLAGNYKVTNSKDSFCFPVSVWERPRLDSLTFVQDGALAGRPTCRAPAALSLGPGWLPVDPCESE